MANRKAQILTLSPLHRWEQGNLVACLQDVAAVLILNANGHQRSFAQPGQSGKPGHQLLEKVSQRAAFGQGFVDLSTAGQVLEIRIKADCHLHVGAGSEFVVADQPSPRLFVFRGQEALTFCEALL